MSRRHFLASLASLASATLFSGLGIASWKGPSADSHQGPVGLQERFRSLEATARGRLGVHILDTATGQEYGYRSDERIMMLSSFKLLACAFVFHRVDAGLESLDRRISYTKNDLINWSPVTEQHADGEGMTLAEFCEATITTSDNTAANLILFSYGGPPALTAYVRGLSDDITRLDRIEPDLNRKVGNELWDTTSPRAMVGNLQKLVLGDALSAQSSHRLKQWLLGNTTGGKRLKAGLPADWQIGDKTGTNKTDANDIGVVWPPNRAPVLVAAYLSESQVSSPVKDATIAAVGGLVREIAV